MYISIILYMYILECITYEKENRVLMVFVSGDDSGNINKHDYTFIRTPIQIISIALSFLLQVPAFIQLIQEYYMQFKAMQGVYNGIMILAIILITYVVPPHLLYTFQNRCKTLYFPLENLVKYLVSLMITFLSMVLPQYIHSFFCCQFLLQS